MSDIVERLRDHKISMHHGGCQDCYDLVMEDAADEIERLRAALTQFVACCDTAPPTSLMIELGMACTVARRALSVTNGVRNND